MTPTWSHVEPLKNGFGAGHGPPRPLQNGGQIHPKMQQNYEIEKVCLDCTGMYGLHICKAPWGQNSHRKSQSEKETQKTA